MQDINEDEAALYDRQIRLWGLDSQKRLRAARVLIVGLDGLGAEICKNTVLAGVNSVTLVDHENITEDDLSAQFFLTKEDIGKNRAECSVEKVKQLNPLVDVTVDTENIDTKPDEFFRNFTVVCVTGAKLKTMSRIDKICHVQNIKFFAGDVYGFYGYMFSDLGDHEFAEERVDFINLSGDVEKGYQLPNAKKTKTGWKVIKTLKRNSTFNLLEDIVDVEVSSEEYKTSHEKVSHNFLLFLVFQVFLKENQRTPTKQNEEKDTVDLIKIRNSLAQNTGFDLAKFGDKFTGFCYGKLSPVCAIIGGVISQEIVKAVSQKDRPFNNFFFFNGITGDGAVEKITSSTA